MSSSLADRLSRPDPGAASRALAALVAAVQRRRLARAVAGALEPRLVLVASPTFGGAGKTPVVAFLARRLLDRGIRVAILGHGHRGSVTHTRTAAGDPVADGDEATELRRALPDVPLWLGRDRAAVLERALDMAEVVVMDSGLGARGIRPGVCVLVEDATLPQRVFPAGYGRFRAEDVPRVDLRWRHKVDEPGASAGVADVESVWAATRVRSADGGVMPVEALADGRWVALSGIARPGSFHAALARAGAAVVECRVFGDHADFPASSWVLPPGLRGITTAKDAARMPVGHGWHVLEGGVRVVRGEGAVTALVDRLGALAAGDR
jgi:tetraacyldisaccharide 4'-kinase